MQLEVEERFGVGYCFRLPISAQVSVFGGVKVKTKRRVKQSASCSSFVGDVSMVTGDKGDAVGVWI